MQTSGMTISRRRIVTAALLVVPLAGLSRLVSTGDVQAADLSVNIMNFKFDPTPLTIPVGSTITWTNQDTAPHTATSDPNSAFTFDTGALQKGQSGKITFNQAGSFAYHCNFHPTMHAMVVVLAAGTTAPSAPAPAPVAPAPISPALATVAPVRAPVAPAPVAPAAPSAVVPLAAPRTGGGGGESAYYIRRLGDG